VEIYINDICGNYYWIDPFLDRADPAQPDEAKTRLKWESPDGCEIISVKTHCSYVQIELGEKKYSFLIRYVCYKAGH